MATQRQENFDRADDRSLHPQLAHLSQPVPETCERPATCVPQIIPEWAIDHLGKKVHFISSFFDGYRTWPAYQAATLDGLQVGEKGVECLVYFHDYDDHGYLSAPAELFMPIYERRPPSRVAAEIAEKPLSSKPRFHAFILGLAIDLLARAGMDTAKAQHTINEHFTFK